MYRILSEPNLPKNSYWLPSTDRIEQWDTVIYITQICTLSAKVIVNHFKIMAYDEITRRRFVQTMAGAGIISIAGCTDQLEGQLGEEQQFPSQKIEMVCPWAAGGGTDRTSRKIAELAGNHLDTSFYVTNKTGGTGSVGFNSVADADPNGYTVGITTVELCIISHLGVSDITPKALKPVMQYNFDPASITVREDAPYGTIQEFVTHAKDNPGTIKVSNSGTGSIWHLSAAGFAQEANIDIKHIGYDGGSPATKAVINGEVQATAASPAEVAPQVKDGPLKVLSIMGRERIDLFPEVPTLKESGFDFTLGAWRGLSVPSETSDDRTSTLHDTYKSVYDSDAFKSFMTKNGFRQVYRGPDEYGTFLSSEYDRFKKIIEQLDISK